MAPPSPGLLLIDDAAHPMSPLRAQGVNLALRDAIVAANHLVPAIRSGTDVVALGAAASAILPPFTSAVHDADPSRRRSEPIERPTTLTRLSPVSTRSKTFR